MTSVRHSSNIALGITRISFPHNEEKYFVSSRDIFLFLNIFDLDCDFEFDVTICVARKPNAKMYIATKRSLRLTLCLVWL